MHDRRAHAYLDTNDETALRHRGYLTDAGYHGVFPDFELVEVHPGSCIAYVDAWISAVSEPSSVVLDPAEKADAHRHR